MDRHQALHCFCRVVETGGFAAAARDLDLSPSLVTKTILMLWTLTPGIKERLKAHVVIDTAVVQMKLAVRHVDGSCCLGRVIP